MDVGIQSLQKKLGYQFKDLTLLQQALSHRSRGKVNNERLEFLGDSILNFLVAETLYQLFPHAVEGELSRLRATVVKGDTLSTIALRLALGPHLMLGLGEMKSGGENRTSILADTVEAILAAIYLDSGIEVCRERIHVWFSPELGQLSLDKIEKDPKSELQEILQAQQIPLPCYALISTSGKEHAQIFVIECSIPSLKKTVLGKSSSRRKAEQTAAANMLKELRNEPA